MVGYGEDIGIVPMMCKEIFRRIEEQDKTGDGSITFRVDASMIEIYNEQVRDLFNPSNNKPGGLEVCIDYKISNMIG